MSGEILHRECLKFFYLILSKVNFRLENPKDMSIGSGLQTGDCSQASCDTNCNFNKKNSGNDVQLDFLEIPGGFTLPTQGATFKYDIKVPNILIMIILLQFRRTLLRKNWTRKYKQSRSRAKVGHWSQHSETRVEDSQVRVYTLL